MTVWRVAAGVVLFDEVNDVDQNRGRAGKEGHEYP